jgi:hypothetical protein
VSIYSKSVHKLVLYAAFLFAAPAGRHNLLAFDDSANPVSKGATPVHGTTSAFVIDPKNGSIVYAATSRGLFKSIDGGANWSPTALTAGVNALAVDPTNRSIMYAATSGRGVFKSVDG